MNSARLNWPPAIPRLLWIRQRCPLCTSIEFRSAEREWLDVFFALFSLRPIRCVNCWRRYYGFRHADTKREEQPVQGSNLAAQAASTEGKSG